MFRNAVIGLMLLVLQAMPAVARPLNIVTDIAPIRALSAAIAGPDISPDNLIPAAISPHDFVLKPSHMRQLAKADLIIWLGPRSTPALARPLARADVEKRLLTLNQLPGTLLLSLRAPGLFGYRPSSITPLAPRPENIDPHSWLAPDNLRLWARTIARRLSALDPDKTATYQGNLKQFLARLDKTERDIRQEFQPPLKPFVQYHDSFQYFERGFGLLPLGAATTGAMESASLGTIIGLRDALADQGDACVFVTSPALKNRAAPLLTYGATLAVVDPLGRDIDPADYTPTTQLRHIAAQMAACLNAR